MKTNNKQTKTKKQTNSNANTGNTESVSELKNRTEQLSETETVKTPETETETETAPQETGTVNAPVKPYVNFAERDLNGNSPSKRSSKNFNAGCPNNSNWRK
jgi:hypothetical protein